MRVILHLNGLNKCDDSQGMAKSGAYSWYIFGNHKKEELEHAEEETYRSCLCCY